VSKLEKTPFHAKFVGMDDFETRNFPDFCYYVTSKKAGTVTLTVIPSVLTSDDDIKQVTLTFKQSNTPPPGPGPTPQPGPTPEPAVKITDRVLLIVPEVLTTAQMETIYGETTRKTLQKYQYLIVPENGVSSVTDGTYQALLKRPRTETPWLITGNYEGPAPKTSIEMLATLLKHNPK
jgi:hypothetical protein